MRPGTRAMRVSLQGRICATVVLENGRQVSAKVHQLSVTGGLLELPTCLEERAKVSLSLPIGADILRPNAEMLFPMWSAQGYLQPFRFTRLWGQERQILEAEITELLKQTLARSTVANGPGSRSRSRSLR